MKKICFRLTAAMIIISAVLFFACDNQSSSDENNYSIIDVFANGSENTVTTKLTIIFDREIPDLTADDIKINASIPLIKGILVKTDDNTYDLELVPGRTNTIRIGLDPYRGFTGWSAKTVRVTAGFYFNGTANLTIIGYGLPVNQNTIIIPDNIAGMPVIAIGDNAFQSRQLTDIIISNTIISIGNGAFYNNRLSNLDDIIPNSVKEIGNNAFANNQLTSIKIPVKLESIGNGAFAGNQITELEFFREEEEDEELTPLPITKLTRFSGFNNNALTTVEIPISVKEIGENAFAYNQIENILTWVIRKDINSYATNITAYQDGAFMYNQLKKIRFYEGTAVIGKNAFCNNQIKEVIFEGTITSIGSSAFAYNKIETITIPNEIITINEGTFRDNQLTEVNFSKNVKNINSEAFRNNQLTEINIPDNVTYIGNEAFRNNRLTKITIGKNVILGIASFGDGFEKIYNTKKEAGIYTRENPESVEWTFTVINDDEEEDELDIEP
ncbi:MAG: leucine-rich repeat domain-containing protein [Treponema sp.]|nr:leucine-rich repeat domain-containing protein [Treponema sp.]